MKCRTVPITIMVLLFSIVVSGCVSSTHVTIESNIPEADVYFDGELVGKTPLSLTVSNAVWDDPVLIFRKEGYAERRASLVRDVKAPNLILGLTIWYPALLWVHGPKNYQYFNLFPLDQ